MQYFEPLRQRALSYLSEQQIQIIESAYRLAKVAHEGQMRSSGAPYITHPVAVATILASAHLDPETLTAAVLHDVIEDTEVTKAQIIEQFGASVANLVDGVSKLDKLKFRTRQEAQVENFRKMIMAMTSDIRVILIKLADRLHNMRTLSGLRPDKQRRIAKETLEIYVPIAHRLGIHQFKLELEELSFKACYPNRYDVLQKVIAKARGSRQELIQQILEELAQQLEKADIDGYVIGREKSLYAIYEKMRLKDQDFESIMDIYSFKVIVTNIDNCYRVLGLVHRLYKPRPGRFKDYIAVPKINGYQSLHTSMVGPHGLPVEVQIRTKDMDQMADKGIAAHWSYDEQFHDIDHQHDNDAQRKAQNWLQSLIELQQNTGSSDEFIEHVKSDFYPDEIYVFTPKGRIIELPDGATCIDFAYILHSEIGNHCVGAKVDRQPYPLSTPLESGQTVEIITSDESKPSPSWLNYAMTSRARTCIRQALKSRQKSESIVLGKRLLKQALTPYKISDLNINGLKNYLKVIKLASIDDLYQEIGNGTLVASATAKQLLTASILDISVLTTNDNELKKLFIEKQQPIMGISNESVSFASCCTPIMNDTIVALAISETELIIHKADCLTVQSQKGRLISVQWRSNMDWPLPVNLEVELKNKVGVLASVTGAIAELNCDIQNVLAMEKENDIFTISLQVLVQDQVHLDKIMRKIKLLPHTLSIQRVNKYE